MKKSILLVALALLTLSGCENKSLTTSGVGINLTGSWTGSITSKIINEFGTLAATLLKTGDGANGVVISGVMIVTNTRNDCYTGGTIDSGKSTMTGDSITLTVTDANGATITFAGIITATTMSGTYTATKLACVIGGNTITADSGTWTLAM